MADFHRVVRIIDGQAYQAAFPMPMPAFAVFGRGVPSGGSDNSIEADNAIGYLQPMPQAAACGGCQPKSFAIGDSGFGGGKHMQTVKIGAQFVANCRFRLIFDRPPYGSYMSVQLGTVTMLPSMHNTSGAAYPR